MGSLLGNATRVHGGMDRWQRVSIIRATVVARRFIRGHAPSEQWFNLMASTRLPLLCLEHRVSGGLVCSFRSGTLAVHGPSGRRLATPDERGATFDDAWPVFRFSEALWLALNSPFIFEAEGLSPVETGTRLRSRRRLGIDAPAMIGGSAKSVVATFSQEGVLRSIHQRMDTGNSVTTTVPTAYALHNGLLFAHGQCLRVSGLSADTRRPRLHLAFHAVTLD
jgi:hypothetical protein